MGEHAILSASGAHRWMHCPPSAQLERSFQDSVGGAALEGTAAHSLAEYKLRAALGMEPGKRPTSPYDGAEMEGHTDSYVTFILEQLAVARTICTDPIVLIEQRLDFSQYVPRGFGTGDCVIIADHTLQIIDFKYGQGVLVDAEDNPQMKLYALGALAVFDGIYDINAVSMTIYQPRRENVSDCTVFKEALYLWAEETLKPIAALAYNGAGEFVPGDWCRFCRARNACRARAEHCLDLARHEFQRPPVLSDEEISSILSRLDILIAWANDIKGYALEAAIEHGKEWPGFKLVEGRSNRKYKDEAAVAKAAIDAGYQEIYRKSLLSITEMEALLGKARFKEILGGLVMKPQGKPTLAPVTDRRPAINASQAKHEFMEE